MPNITGSFTAVTNARPATVGAFTRADGGQATVEPENNQFHHNDTFYFNAANVSSIYGASFTVQPPSIKVRVYTRYQ